jgi:hypothetical protein
MEAGALADLERAEAELRSYAAERGLELSDAAPWPGYQPPEQQSGPIRHAVWSLSGKLPGGAVGRLRHQAAFGQTMGIDVGLRHTIMICRMPETVGYVPMLCVRPAELGSGLYYWGGDQRPRESQEFESSELNRRFVVEIAKGQGQNWLWQLLSPALIDWLAHETPPDFGFKLETGVFTCEAPEWRGQGKPGGDVDPEHLDLLADCGGRVAGRLRNEVLEELGTGSASAPDSAQAYADWVAAPTHGRIIGTILKLAGADKPDESVASWGERHRMSPESPATFHARHSRLPLPGTATDVVTGPLPVGGFEGSAAWIKFSSPVDVESNYVAIAADVGRELEPAWVDAEEIGTAGFGDDLPAPALEAARAAGYGISAGGTSACVYLRGPGLGSWPRGAEIDAFLPRAAEIIATLR